MALALQKSPLVWKKVESFLSAGDHNPAAKFGFKGLQDWLAQQKRNPDLQFVNFDGTVTDNLAGQDMGINEAHRLFGIYGRKVNTPGDAWTVVYDALAAAGGGGSGPSLGAAQGFVVLGSSTVTNTGPSVLIGDLGLYAGTSVTGFPPGTVSGTQHIANAQALAAQNSLTTLLAALAALPSTETLAPGVVIGTGGTRPSFTAGVYDWATSGQLTGAVTLTGSSTDVFVFRTGSTMTTASASSVILAGGAIAANVFWRVGSSATLGTTTAMIGNIAAEVSITATTGASVNGRMLASTGAVTLDSNAASLADAGGSGASASADGILSLPFKEANRDGFAIFSFGVPMATNLLVKSYTTFDGVVQAPPGDSAHGFIIIGAASS